MLVVGILVGVFSSAHGQGQNEWGVPGLSVDSLVTHLAATDGRRECKSPRIVVWIRLDDLSCGACLEDFVTISAVAHSRPLSQKEEILYLVEKDNRPFEILRRVVDRWRQIHSISYPIYVVVGFSQFGLQKSCVLFRKDDVFVGEYMPMSYEKRAVIISRMTD